MPEKERKRMVVEEVELPASSKPEVEAKVDEHVEEAEHKPEILDDGAKISSQDVIADDKAKPIEQEPVVEIPFETKKQKTSFFWIIIPCIFILGAILGGIFFYQKGVNKGQGVTASPTPNINVVVNTPAPSATPSAVDLTKYTVDILNGSGIAGEAGKVKTLLTTAGFTIGTIGNAATYDYTKTIIKAKSTVDAAFLSKLSASIAKSYVVGDSETLTSGTTDVQVIVGTSKAP